MRTIITLAILSVLAPATAWAQDCGELQPVNSLQMTRDSRGLDHVPVGINGAKKSFLFDTGGGRTSVSKNLAIELHLPIEASNLRMRDISGNISSSRALVREFQMGRLRTENSYLPVLSPLREDGLYAPDQMRRYDVEVDFGTDTLNYFSQKNCPGKVPHWRPAAMAEFPIGRDGFNNNRLVVPVTLDGHDFDAVIDTGASNSTLRADIAQQIFGLTPGGPGTPRIGVVNGDPKLPVYSHQFKSLTFAGVTVSNAKLSIVADAMGQKLRPFQPSIHAPPLLLGMDVLRKLRFYLAFGEMRMYLAPASVPPDRPAKGPR